MAAAQLTVREGVHDPDLAVTNHVFRDGLAVARRGARADSLAMAAAAGVARFSRAAPGAGALRMMFLKLARKFKPHHILSGTFTF
jgi:hypothetical protein